MCTVLKSSHVFRSTSGRSRCSPAVATTSGTCPRTGAGAAGGVIELRRRLATGRRPIDWWVLPYGIALYPSAIAMVFSGQSRFHYPVMPFVCVTAGWLLARWLERRANAPVVNSAHDFAAAAR